jgi:UDP-galactopyranose mutase
MEARGLHCRGRLMTRRKVLVVGAGFAGCTVSRCLADMGFEVLLIDKRDHIGGNAYDVLDSAGVLVHPYGPHIFHTNSDRILAFLTRFTAWRRYEHRSVSSVNGHLVPFPINIDTLNSIFSLDLNEISIKEYLNVVRTKIDDPRNSEEYLLSSVGREIYELFFSGYIWKQWGLSPTALKPSVVKRVAVRFDRNDRYFLDRHQVMPAEGYTAMFRRMLDHPGISLDLGTRFRQKMRSRGFHHTIYTGCISDYYNNVYGALPYRSVRVELEYHHGVERLLPAGSVNHPGPEPYTRVSEFKYLTGQIHPGTTISREHPGDSDEPSYPIPTDENEAMLQRYRSLADRDVNVSFLGRLGEYRYYNMDQVVASAISLAQQLGVRLR